jgi:hypothetical protein
MQKAAVRNLVTSLDVTLATDGIRAVAVQVNGVLAKEGPLRHPRWQRRCTPPCVPNDDCTAQVPFGG